MPRRRRSHLLQSKQFRLPQSLDPRPSIQGRRRRRLLIEVLDQRRVLATITVTGLGDEIAVDGVVTLREAIEAANTNLAVNEAPPGEAGVVDTIRFHESLRNLPIVLGGTELVILEDVALVGLGREGTIIDADAKSRVLRVQNGSLLLEGLTLRGGNTVETQAGGGGIRFESPGPHTIKDARITGNRTGGEEASGGGISVDTGTLRIERSEISHNGTVGRLARGGGLNSRAASVSIHHSSFESNFTEGDLSHGGAISFPFGNNSPLSLFDSSVLRNQTSGVLAVGGGVYLTSSGVISRSTIAENQTSGNNSAGGGALLACGADLSMHDSTVSGNRVLGATVAPEFDEASGGGLAIAGSATITGSTITGNQTTDPTSFGGGLDVYCNGEVKLTNTIVAGNDAPKDAEISLRSFGAAITSGGSNLIGRGAGGIQLRTSDEALAGRVYEAVSVPEGISWDDANAAAIAAGGHLATLNSDAENIAVFELVNDPVFWISNGTFNRGPWLGGFQDPGATSPGEGWQWVTGEAISGTDPNWETGEPNDSDGVENQQQDRLSFFNRNPTPGITELLPKWDDAGGMRPGYIIEYPAVDFHPTDIVGVDPQLGPLADNGGPTPTHALREGSPAIDAGSALITPVAVTSSTAATDFWPASNLIDGSGLSGTVDDSTYATLQHQPTTANNAWVTTAPAFDYFTALPGPVLTFDLGATYDVTEMVVWGYGFNGIPNGNEAKTFAVSFSTDGGQTFGESQTVSTTSMLVTGSETLAFASPQLANVVRVEITDNRAEDAGGGDRVGLSEIRFRYGGSDQRGAPFVRQFGDRIDMGAYERQTLPESTLVVDSLLDEDDGDYSAGDLSLREAIRLAHGSIGPDTITFDSSLSGGTILLELGELVISESLTIDASGLAEPVVIDANQASRVLNYLGSTGDLELNHLTLQNGRTTGENQFPFDATHSGAGVRFLSSGALTIRQSTLRGNEAAGNGGAIFAATNFDGTVVNLFETVVVGNSAIEGGGIRVRFGTLNIIQSSISDNTAINFGGGISIANGNANAEIRDSTIAGNEAHYGGGIFAFDAEVTVTGSTISQNRSTSEGGGMLLQSTSADVSQSTIAGNLSPSGAGILGSNSMLLTRGTIVSQNSSLDGDFAMDLQVRGTGTFTSGGHNLLGGTRDAVIWTGSEIANGHVYEVVRVPEGISWDDANAQAVAKGGHLATITSAEENAFVAALVNDPSYWRYLNGFGFGPLIGGRQTDLTAEPAGNWRWVTNEAFDAYTNWAPGEPNNFGGIEHTLLYFNAEAQATADTWGDISSSNPVAVAYVIEYPFKLDASDLVGVDPRLGPLADNGGPTLTHALLEGSPAIDAGSALITPVSVTSSTAATDLWPASNLIDGSGLTGPIDDATYATRLHASTNSQNAWVTRAFLSGEYYLGLPNPILTFDLGATYDVSEMVVWGYGFNGLPNGNEAKTFEVSFSTDGGLTFGEPQTVSVTSVLATGSETLSFASPQRANMVRVEITDNRAGESGTGDRVGLSEVRFRYGGTDQRNAPFIRQAGSRIDIGAYESQSIDFGDAPFPYPTLIADNGASHQAIGPRLGARRDGEFDGMPSSGADGDDLSGGPDSDEDGVMFGVIPSTAGLAGVNIWLGNAASARVDAWIDFNRDGDWDDPGEKILDSVEVFHELQTLNYVVPDGVTPGDTYARVRISSAGGLGPFGPAPDGEVEDYLITIPAPPVVESVVINDGASQRSTIDRVTVTFDRIVGIDETNGDPFVVTNLSTGEAVVDEVTVLTVGGKTVVQLSFLPGPLVNNAGGLIDGSYQLMIIGDLIRADGMKLDGAGDGSSGGDHSFTDDFFRLYGDQDGNGAVNLSDFAVFRSAFGSSEGDSGYLQTLDSDANGIINLSDFAAFRRNFGSTRK